MIQPPLMKLMHKERIGITPSGPYGIDADPGHGYLHPTDTPRHGIDNDTIALPLAIELVGKGHAARPAGGCIVISVRIIPQGPAEDLLAGALGIPIWRYRKN